MRPFKHFNAYSLEEAVSLLDRYGERACIIAGGTDLLGKMKDMILPSYPEALVNIKSIPGMESIRMEEDVLRIGSLTKLSAIAENPIIREKYTALAQAASRTASPNLRNMGTIGGNICQDIRCWYYRAPSNRFSCLRKGGGRCYAIKGDNRYHSIFGGSVKGGCFAVHPSDTAPALIALNAKVVTSKRTYEAENFFNVGLHSTTVLESNEIVVELQLPKPSNGAKSAFVDYTQRKSIDFPIVNCAVMMVFSNTKMIDARICLNAVHVVPYRPKKAELALIGHTYSDRLVEEAGEIVVAEAKPLDNNKYMVQIAKTLAKRAIQACREAAVE